MEEIKKDLMKCLNGMKTALDLNDRARFEEWRQLFEKKMGEFKQLLNISLHETPPEIARDRLVNFSSLKYDVAYQKSLDMAKVERDLLRQLQKGMRWIHDQKL